jgi:predicted RNA binding protein YcfA (HicA-like mRNA interferase family)
MKIRNVIRIIEADGWYKVNQEGSHRQYKHPVKKGRVTVAGALNEDVLAKTLKSIFRQAGLAR